MIVSGNVCMHRIFLSCLLCTCGVCVIVIVAPPKSIGWEKNAKNKLTPRKVDLSSSMDPVRYVNRFPYCIDKQYKVRLAAKILYGISAKQFLVIFLLQYVHAITFEHFT